MKRTLLRLLPWLLLLAVSAVAQSDPAPSERTRRARQATEQRMALAASPKYSPYNRDNRDIRKNASELLETGRPTEAIAVAERGLERFPCDIDLRVILAMAWEKAGNVTKAEAYNAEWTALMDSIMESGDGRSSATAFKVIAVDEEYSVARILRLKVAGQKLVHENGSAYDVLTVQRAEKDETMLLYFNIDLPMKWMAREFAVPAKK